MTTATRQKAAINLACLAGNPYPGRGVLIGHTESGHYMVQATWLMGRSESSRNRVYNFDSDHRRVFTEPADPAKMAGKDTSLLIYNAMMERHGVFIASNGHQTDEVLKAVTDSEATLGSALHEFQYEPDAPNFTPRITAMYSLVKGDWAIQFAILKRSLWSEECDRHIFRYKMIGAGYGLYVSTYVGNGDPLPSWEGEPIPIILYGSDDPTDIAENLWANLDLDNRVSLAVKLIEPIHGNSRTYIINEQGKCIA